ncbi:MAG: beta-ketoacyl-[acyl-carrier-protein] synthase family protein [Thermodesulfobacteriota bacterium]
MIRQGKEATRRRVVITGMGIVTAFGAGKTENLNGLKNGTGAIGKINSFDVSQYRGKTGGEIRDFVFNLSLKTLRPSRLDRASKLLLTAFAEASFEAGFADNGIKEETIVVLGTTLGGMASGERFYRDWLKKGFNKTKPSLLLDYLAHYQGMHLIEENNLDAEVIIISNACASGTNAIGYAFDRIRSGDVDIAIAGGYDTMCEFTFAGFNSLMAVTPDLCRPFDRNRDGLILGEGVGIIIMEDLEHALSRKAKTVGEITGYGESSDAFHMTRPDPDGSGAALAMERALEDADIKPRDVEYINAHGTGTPYNDLSEAKAINSVFGKHAMDIPVSSIKPMIGHLLGGAGAVEAIATTLAMNNRFLPMNLNYEISDPECPVNVVTCAAQRDVRTAISNSFGFGGANATVVMQKFEVPKVKNSSFQL